MPFAALKDLAGTYLIERHTLTSSPSVQVMGLANEQGNTVSATGRSLLIIGNPVMPSLPEQNYPLADLPGAQTEAIAIAQLLQTEPLLQAAASETRVLREISQAPILHFATHGLLDLDARLNAYGETVTNEQPTARESNVFITPGAVTISGNVTINGVPAAIVHGGWRRYSGGVALGDSGCSHR